MPVGGSLHRVLSPVLYKRQLRSVDLVSITTHAWPNPIAQQYAQYIVVLNTGASRVAAHSLECDPPERDALCVGQSYLADNDTYYNVDKTCQSAWGVRSTALPSTKIIRTQFQHYKTCSMMFQVIVDNTAAQRRAHSLRSISRIMMQFFAARQVSR